VFTFRKGASIPSAARCNPATAQLHKFPVLSVPSVAINIHPLCGIPPPLHSQAQEAEAPQLRERLPSTSRGSWWMVTSASG